MFFKIKGDDRVFIAENEMVLITQMKNRSFLYDDDDDSIDDYMDDVARRMEKTQGFLVRTHTPEAFIADLTLFGYVERIDLN